MKRRAEIQTSAEGTQTGQQASKREHYSVRPYIVLLFVAVIVLMVLSYFVQQRRNSATIDSMTESHNQFSIEALQNIEALQQSNLQLRDRVQTLEGDTAKQADELDALRAELAAAQEALAQAEDGQETERARAETLAALLRLALAADGEDPDELAEARQAAEALQSRMDPEQQAALRLILERIEAAQTPPEEQIETEEGVGNDD